MKRWLRPGCFHDIDNSPLCCAPQADAGWFPSEGYWRRSKLKYFSVIFANSPLLVIRTNVSLTFQLPAAVLFWSSLDSVYSCEPKVDYTEVNGPHWSRFLATTRELHHCDASSLKRSLRRNASQTTINPSCWYHRVSSSSGTGTQAV